MKEEWLKKGYVSEPVDKMLDLKAEIRNLLSKRKLLSWDIFTKLMRFRK